MKFHRVLNASLAVAAGTLALFACQKSAPEQADPAHAERHADGEAHAAAHVHAAADAQPAFTVKATPLEPLEAGAPATLAIRLADKAGAPIGHAAITTSHEHLLHVMVVDSGLEDYAHLHPDPAGDDAFKAQFTPRFARTYRLWADFTSAAVDPHDAHAGHGAAHAPTRVATDLVVGKDPRPPLAAVTDLTDEAGGLKFALILDGPLRAGATTSARLDIADASSKPFDRLEPLMGAYAHVVGFSRGAETMLHAHPEGPAAADGAARGGPELRFSMTPEASGPHRLFVQVRVGGSVILARFSVVVGPHSE